MTNISDYESSLVTISKSILLEVFAILNEYKDYLVLVGGWVPFLLLENFKNQSLEFSHIGSIDIDIALDYKNFPGLDEAYASIRTKLEKNNYRVRTGRDGLEIPHSFERVFMNNSIHIDFLASETSGTGKQHRHQLVQDILARKTKGIDLAFQNKETIILNGILPNDAKYSIGINIAGIAAFLSMKSFAFTSDISRLKDIYDIYSILKYYKDGIKDIIIDIHSFCNNNLFIEAINRLKILFSEIDSIGPVGLADFILPEGKGSEDWEFYRRDVFELINEFLDKI
jgi:hypothetical protein